MSFPIVIIGGGVAGLSAAWTLVRAGKKVTILEQTGQLGGACRPVSVPLSKDQTLKVDLGVSDFNLASYKAFKTLLDQLEVNYHPICQDAVAMDSNRQALWWTRHNQLHTHLNGLSAEIAHFQREAYQALAPHYRDWPLSWWLQKWGYSDTFARSWLYPRASGCFLMPSGSPENYPLQPLIRFWSMHGIVGPTLPDRCRVQGGMFRYIPMWTAALAAMGVDIKTHSPVRSIRRGTQGIQVRLDDQILMAEAIVMATSPNVVLSLLAKPTAAEQACLGALRFARTDVVAHSDPTVMPLETATWSAYVYQAPSPDLKTPTVTFWANRLGNLPAQTQNIFISVNPRRPLRSVWCRQLMIHPQPMAQPHSWYRQLSTIQGKYGVWWAGSWTTIPFLHEQAILSGIEAARGILQLEDDAVIA